MRLRMCSFVGDVLEFLRPQMAGTCVDIFCDASSASRKKKNDLKFRFIQELVREGESRNLHVGTEDQYAHILTKVL